MSFDFDAGKYAAYLWPAFVISAAAFAWLIADSVAGARRWKQQAERLQAELDALKS